MAAQANVALGITAQNSTAAAFRGARQNVQGLRQSVDGMGGSVLRNRRLVQQFGMQVSDLSVQIAGGQSAILALTQQVPQFVQGFGAMGGALAAIITIVGTVALVMTKTGKGLSDITPIAGVLRQEVEWLVMAFQAVGNAVVFMANLVVNNLDRIAITLSVIAGIFIGRFAVGLAMSAAAAFSLSGALLFLRGALIRTGILAFVVLIGELIFQFMRLREAVGGTAEAMALVGNVFLEIWERVKIAFNVTVNYIKAGFFTIAAAAASRLGVMVGYAAGVWQRIGAGAQALVGILSAVWAGIEAGWNDMLSRMVGTFGSFMSAIGGALSSIPMMADVGREVEIQGMLAIASSREFSRAASEAQGRAASLGAQVDSLKGIFSSPLESKDNWLSTSAVVMDMMAKGYSNLASALSSSISAPLTSIEAIRNALAGLTDESQIDVRDWFKSVEEGAGGAGGAIDKAAKSVETFQQSVAKTLISGLDRLFDSMFEGGKKAVEALRDIGKELLKMVAKQSFYNILAKLLPSTFGAGGFLDLGAAGSLKPYAKGGIVNAPTAFPMRGGKTGLMGEAGPEAILPLTRGANGSLGVAAAGGGGGGAVQVNVITPPGSSVEQSERQGTGGVTIRDIVIKEVQAGIASGQMDRVNRQRYNMAPVPAKR